MTSELQQSDQTDTTKPLLDEPQRLGILPTWRFWREENARLIRWPSAIVAGILIFSLSASTLPWYIVGPAAGVTYTLILGAFERYIRRRALARRLLADAKDRAMRLAEGSDPEGQANREKSPDPLQGFVHADHAKQ